MKGLLGIVGWWQNGQPAVQPPTYQITCACGQSCEGVRQAKHQIIRCLRCSRELFVLPFSPLPPVMPPGAESATTTSRWGSR